MPNRSYRNSIKTKERIQSTYFDFLIHSKKEDKITIVEICDQAEITRSTFYNHYKSIEEVEHDLSSYTSKKASEVINTLFSDYISATNVLIKLNQFFRDNYDPLSRLCSNATRKTISLIFDAVRDTAIDRISDRFTTMFTNSDKKAVLIVFITGVLGLYLNVLINQEDYSFDEIKELSTHSYAKLKKYILDVPIE